MNSSRLASALWAALLCCCVPPPVSVDFGPLDEVPPEVLAPAGDDLCRVARLEGGRAVFACPGGVELPAASCGSVDLPTSFVVRNDVDARGLLCVRSIAGRLSVHPTFTGAIRLPRAVRLGAFWMAGGRDDVAVESPLLARIDGDASLVALRSATWIAPALEESRGLEVCAGAVVVRFDAFRGAEDVRFTMQEGGGLTLPALVEASGSFQVSGGLRGTVSLPALTSVGNLTISDLGGAAVLSAPRLTRAARIALVNTAGVESLEFPSLSQLGPGLGQGAGGLVVSGSDDLRALRLPRLARVDGDIVLGGESLQAIDLGALVEVRASGTASGGFSFVEGAGPLWFALRALRTIDGALVVDATQTVMTLDLPELRSAGALLLRENESLRRLQAPLLARTPHVEIRGNPRLSECDVSILVARLDPGPSSDVGANGGPCTR